MNPAMICLLAPYTATAWLSSRWFTRKHPAAREIAGGVWLGRLPRKAERDAQGIYSMVDLTAELPVNTRGVKYRGIPMLDLIVPSVERLTAAVTAIDNLEGRRPTLVCCALGYSRSASAVAAWLAASGRAASVDGAIDLICARGSRIVLGPAHRRRIEHWVIEQGVRAREEIDGNDAREQYRVRL
jgi:protein-tyrosine phosphatase